MSEQQSRRTSYVDTQKKTTLISEAESQSPKPSLSEVENGTEGTTSSPSMTVEAVTTKIKEPEKEVRETKKDSVFGAPYAPEHGYELLCSLMRDVTLNRSTMRDAAVNLHADYKQLSEENQAEFKSKARDMARRLSSVAEGFAQELVTIAAG